MSNYGFSLLQNNLGSRLFGFSVDFDFNINIIVRLDGTKSNNSHTIRVFDDGSNTLIDTLETFGNGIAGFNNFEARTLRFETEFEINGIVASDTEIIIHDGISEETIFLDLVTPPFLIEKSSNRHNFFHWQLANNLFIDTLGEETTRIVDFPEFIMSGFERNNRCSRPILVPGEETSVYINFNDQTNQVPNSTLAIIRYSSVVLDNVAPINIVGLSSDAHMQFSYTPPETLSDGYGYRFIIYDSSNNKISFVSNEFRVSSSDYESNSVYLDYKNSTNILNFRYESLSFSNKVRVEINQIESQGEYNLKQYEEQTTGIIRNQKSQSKKILILESYFFDEHFHDAMRGLSTHDTIMINGDVMEVKEGYKVEANKFNSVQKGTIEVYDQKYSTINLKR